VAELVRAIDAEMGSHGSSRCDTLLAMRGPSSWATSVAASRAIVRHEGLWTGRQSWQDAVLERETEYG
jgi:hypothetical protein